MDIETYTECWDDLHAYQYNFSHSISVIFLLTNVYTIIIFSVCAKAIQSNTYLCIKGGKQFYKVK